MKQRAISEVAGTMVLIGVIVLGMIIVNLVVFSTPTQTRIPSLEASMANRSTLITIVHQGGDSIDLGDFQILVDGVDQTGEFTNSGTFPWSVGETLSFNAPSMPQSAVMIYNGTGKGGVVILQSRFPWGVYVSGYQGGSGGEGAGGGGGFIPTTPVETYPWYDCAWGYRKNITIDHAKVSGDQANFPVLISLSSDSDLSTHAQANGNDILFTTDNGVTKISHEIESYSGGTLVAWVNVSSLSSTTDTTIMMYYGNSGAPSQQNAANVWDTGYKGVWHLNEASDTTRSDSTGNNNDLSDVNTVARSGSGMMAGAASFIQANSERLAITDATQTGLDITGDLTVEAWFRLSSTGSGPYSILEKHRGTCGSGQPPYLFRLSDGDPGYVQDVLRVTDICTGAGTDVTGTTNSISPASWYHLVGISNSTYLVLYKNGVETAAVAYSSGIFNSDGDFSVGGRAGLQYFEGLIDEVRVSGTVRPRGWIATEYANQYSPSDFYDVETQVESPSSCATVTPTPTVTPEPGWYDCDWYYRKNLTIDHTKVTGTLSGFPVLVNLTTDSDLHDHAQDDGDDIFFTDAAGNRLPHEIEYYNFGDGGLAAWVKVPSLSSAADTTIIMYYGNSGVSSQEEAEDVWDASFRGVWHLTNDVLDSTSNSNDGTDGGTSDTYGQIGRSRRFDGSTDSIEVPDSTSLHIGGPLTVEAWLRPTYLSGWSTVVSKMEDTSTLELYLAFDGTEVELDMLPAVEWGYSGVYFSTGSWQHLAMTYDGSNTRFYKNGAHAGNVIAGSGTLDLASNTDPMYIGYNTGWGEYWNGRIDELRISSANRSYEWIATEYANQYSPGTFFKTIGTQGESSCSVTPTPTPPGGFPWYDCDWGYRKNITIDYTKVSGAQTNFPVLVSLSSDTGLSGHAQGDGDDILFTASDGTTKLSHEIESYTSSTGALTAWVKIPSLSATSNTVIMMYYGNSGASSQQVRNGVWDSSYKGVWHLNETVTEESTSGTHYDSTSNGNDGTQHNNGPITGKVGGAQYFDGTSDYITVLSDPSLDITSSFTMEAWVYLADATNNQKIVGNLDLSHGYLLGVPNAGGIYPEVYDSTHTMHDFESGSFSSSTWTHLVMNWTTNGRFSGFINGNPVYSEAAGSSSIGVSSGPLRMGVAPWDTGAFPVTGRIDEVRISSTSRSPGWIKTEYDNMNSPSTFSSVDNQVSSPCSVTPTPTPSVTWYDCSWQERKKVTIDHTKVYGTQGNFSVLVSLSSDSDLAAHAQSDFDDILFTASDGTTKLSHDIESYTSGTGALTSWVRVPSLSSSTDTVLYLYYGNPSAGDQRDKTNAWDPDYKGVWHLSNLLDSTNNVNDVSSSGSASATGKMANARSFDGNDYLTRADTSTLDMTAGQDFTVSAWVRSTQGATFNNWPVIMRKVNDDVSPQSRGYGLFLHNSDTDNRWFFEIQYQSGPPYPDVYGVSNIADDTWHYIVGVREGSTIYAYEDDHTRSSASGNSGDLSNNNPMRMGSNCVTPNPNNLWYTGRLDELRVSKVARSAGWIATEYANQNSPSTFSSLSGVESAPCTPVPTTPPTPTAIPTPSPPWYNCYWTYRKNITINKAYVSGTQTDFPALISLSSDSGLRDHARTDGGDIFFTTSNGQTIIPHERESYTPSTGALTAWVKVPQIQSTANTSIFMYYGYPASPDMSSPTNVWDQYYRAVWHLNEDFPNEVYSGKVHNESTSNANNALQRNNSRITGKIAGGQYFDGNMDYLDVPTTTNLNITKNLTLETWMYTSSATDQKLIYKYSPIPSRNGGYGLGVGGNVGNPGRIYWEIYGANAVRYSEETVGPSIATGSWTHVAVTWGKGERIRSYVNGALVNTPVVNGNTDINASLIVPAPRLGAPSWTGIPANAFHLNGGLDEVRISSINRSTSWILTEWRNQDSPSTFTAIGPQEGYSCGGGSGPAYVQSRSLSFGSASQASISLPSATTAGNLLLLSLVMDSQALSVSSVTDTKNGAVYNLALAPTNVGTWGKLYTYYVNNSLGGSGAITATVTLSGTTPALLDVFFLEYSGVAAVSPLDQTSAGSGTGTVMNSGAKDITNATELIYGFGADDYECHATAPYTDRETANGQCAVDWSVSLSGTYNVTATQSSSGAWALQMATFKGA